VKNHHSDRLVEILNKQKEQASKDYFENLFKKSGKLKQSGEHPVEKPLAKFSPIEEMFRTHLKKSLMVYEEFYKVFKFKL
jgi:hypothetical protein